MVDPTSFDGGENLVAKKGVQLVNGKEYHWDQPFDPGSPEAQKAWAQIDADAHSPDAVAQAKAISGNEKAIGMYNGKPLIPGHQGTAEHPEGDADFLRDKLIYTKGLDPAVAGKVVGAIRYKLYGVNK